MPLDDRYRRGDAITAKDLNEVLDAVKTSMKVSVSPPLRASYNQGGGTAITLDDDGSFMAVILAPSTDSECGGYGYREVIPMGDSPGDWTDREFGRQGTCGAYEWNDSTVPADTIARLFPTGEPDVYTFWFGSGSGSVGTTGGVEFVRIDNYFCKDTNPPVSSPSPLCYYPGTVMSLTSAGWSPTATTVWVVFWFTYASVPPISMSAPYTVVIVVGTAAHMASPMGFSYAPNDNGVHPNSGESRAVYGSTEYSAGWAIQCVDGQPTITLGG